jgi:hypothetical protein
MSRPTTFAPVLAAALALAACAPAPSGARVSLDQDPTTLDALTVRLDGPATTARDADMVYRYAWFVDGALVTDLTEDTVAPERTRKGQTWTVEVRPFDGKKEGPVARASTTVVNSAPEVVVTVSNNTPISTQSVQATVEFSDADNDPVEIRYTWFRDGRKVPEMRGPDLLPDLTRRGQVWRVQVVGNDGEVDGYTDHQDILIQNGAPVVVQVELGPERPFTVDDLMVVASAEDPDLDPTTLRYRWFIDGVERGGVTGPAMTADRTRRGNVIQVEVTASDDELVSEPRLSNALTILNTPPGAATVVMAPSAPTAEANIVCAIATPPVDPDGDAMTYTFAWTRDGAPWTGPTGRTTHDGDTILAAYTALDDVWTCTVTPNDGEADGPLSVATATVVSWTGPREFTNCGVTGQNGPTQADCDGAYRGTPLADDGVVVSAGIQEWEVPSSGRYRITAYGAQGKAPDSRVGGKGAKISGVFDLDGGQKLKIAVGQEGSSDGNQGGGGGGSWVMTAGDEPLLVAGGGGGLRSSAGQDGCGGRTTELGGTGSGWNSTHDCGAKSSGVGLGGIVSSSSYGSAGGGYETNGASDYGSNSGGKSWFNGLTGGGDTSYRAYGGFGGGGAGDGSWGGGGGGGYSGGDGGYVPGAGGSYNGGADADDESGVQSGHGQVVIDLE